MTKLRLALIASMLGFAMAAAGVPAAMASGAGANPAGVAAGAFGGASSLTSVANPDAAAGPFSVTGMRALTARAAAQYPQAPAGPLAPATDITKIDLPDWEDAAVEGFGSMWVTAGNYQSTDLVRVDLGTNQIVDTIDLGKAPVFGSPGELTVGAGAVWVPKFYENEVIRVDPTTDSIVAHIPVGTSPIGILYAFGSIWVANSLGGSISRIDPSTNQVVATIPAGYKGAMTAGPWQLAATSDAVWVDNGRPYFISTPGAKTRIQRIDPTTNTVIATIRTSADIGCDTMVPIGTSLWLDDDNCDGGLNITRIDTTTNQVAQTVQIVQDPSGCVSGLTALGDTMWAAIDRKLDPKLGFCGYGALEQLDPSTGAILATYGLGRRSVFVLSPGGGDLWTAAASGRRPAIFRIGTPMASPASTRTGRMEGANAQAAPAALVRGGTPAASSVAAQASMEPAGGTSTGGVEERIHEKPGPEQPIDAFGLVWTLSGFWLDRFSYLQGVDPATNRVVKSYFVGDSGGGLAAADGSLWVSKWYENTVERIDPNTGAVLATIPTDLSPNGVLYAFGSIWVANHRGRDVNRIDPASNQVIATIAAGDQNSFRSGPAGLAAGPDAVWVSAGNIGTVQRIDPSLNEVVLTAPFLGYDINLSIRTHGGSLYVNLDDVYYRLAQDTGQVTGTIPTDPYTADVAFQGGSLWISSDHITDPNTGRTTAILTGFDIATLHQVGRVHVGGFSGSLLPAGNGEMWMTDPIRNVLDRIALP